MTIEERIEKLKKNAIRQADLEKKLYRAVEEISVDEPRFPLSPSQVLKPLRDLYYDLQNFTKPGSVPRDPLPGRVRLTFEVGHMVEAALVKYFKEAFQVKNEQERVTFGKLPDGRDLSGAIDWAIKLDSGEVILCDSKSIGDFPFKSAPKEDNIAQMQLYMHSDWGKRNKVTRCLLVYFNKNDSDLKFMEIGYDPVLAEELVQKLYMAYDYFKRGEIPEREYVLGLDWRADYSNYATYDNAEFAQATEREVADPHEVAPGPAPKVGPQALREHVMRYGSKIVEYQNGESHYVRLITKKDRYGKEKRALELVIEGQEQNYKAI